MTPAWKRRTEREPDRFPVLPYPPFEVSNGEFVPAAPSKDEVAAVWSILDRCDDAARRHHIDRRLFLTRTGAMAATLGVLNACASAGNTVASPAPGPTPTAPLTATPPPTPTVLSPTVVPTEEPGGQFEEVDPADEEACDEILGSQGEFIFDVHTHHVVPDGAWRQTAPGIASMILNLVPAGCAEADPYVCLDRAAYVNDMFLASDTTVSLLSDVPNGGDETAPVPYADKIATAQFAESLAVGGQPRVLVQDVVAPNFGVLEDRLDMMAEHAASGYVASFKVYTAWGPDRLGFSLESDQIGLPFVQQVIDSGVGILSGHKGLPIQGFDLDFNDPGDLVAAAAANPDLQVVVYHSAFARETYEGPYDPAGPRRGTNALIQAMDDHAMAPNSNVWCELGTAWRELMRDPTQAAHLLGKLLCRVGERRVLWGTDAIWFGSPQPQIMAFRAFQISEEFQDLYGYPALTADIKARVLGLNAAELYGTDPDGARCAIDATGLETARVEHRELVRGGVLPSPYTPRGPITRRQVLQGLRQNPQLLSPL